MRRWGKKIYNAIIDRFRMADKDDIFQHWMNLMDPERLKPNLELISLYITVYEMLEDMIAEKPKGFFMDVSTEGDTEYKKEVLSLYNPLQCPLIRKRESRSDRIPPMVEEDGGDYG